MNTLDYTLIAALAVFFIYGYFKGFARQVLLLIGIGVSFFLASRYHTALAETSFLSNLREHSETATLVVTFLGIFFLSSMFLCALASSIGEKARSLKIGTADRWLGAALGGVIGVFLLGGIALGLKEWQFPEGAAGKVIPESTRQKAEGLVTDSVLVPTLTEACLELIAFIHEKREEAIEILEKKPDVTDDSLTSYSSANKEESKTPTPPPTQSRPLDLGARHERSAEEARVKPAEASAATTTKGPQTEKS